MTSTDIPASASWSGSRFAGVARFAGGWLGTFLDVPAFARVRLAAEAVGGFFADLVVDLLGRRAGIGSRS
jgi:hypothetical protein